MTVRRKKAVKTGWSEKVRKYISEIPANSLHKMKGKDILEIILNKEPNLEITKSQRSAVYQLLESKKKSKTNKTSKSVEPSVAESLIMVLQAVNAVDQKLDSVLEKYFQEKKVSSADKLKTKAALTNVLCEILNFRLKEFKNRKAS